MPDRLTAFVPRLLDQPWDGARIVAAAVLCCRLTGLAVLAERAQSARQATDSVDDVLAALVATAIDHGGDVLSISAEDLWVLFTGEGRHGRAVNTAHAMHDAGTDAPVGVSVGVASGLVHLVTAGEDPKQLLPLGPTVTRARQLATLAGEGRTRSEAVDRSIIETQGRPVAWPASHFIPEVAVYGVDFEPERIHVAAGVAAFSGVDRALQRNPSRAVHQIAAVVGAVQRAAAEFGITVLGYDPGIDGGRLFLAAGLSGIADGAEERMIQAARAAIEATPPFGLRFGVATGPALAGVLGGPQRCVYGVVGTTMTLAERLAASAAPGEVLTTHRTVDRATTRYAVGEWEPMTFAGLDGHVVPVVVGDELASPPAEGGFVGRSQQRATIVRSLRALGAGSQGVVDVVGAAGTGKSRLVAEALRDSNLPTLFVRCEEFQQGIAYGAAARLMRAALDIDEQGDPKRAGLVLRAQVRELTPYLERWMPLLAGVVHAAVDPTPEVAELDPAFRGAKTRWAVGQLAVWLTRGPVVVRVEDAHWMDAASADLLSSVLAAGGELSWLVISTRRPGEVGWVPGDELGPTRIDLGPLTPGASRALLTELRRDHPLPPQSAAKIVERSAGNPLFLERLARLPAASKLPTSAAGSIATEIDQLPDGSRTALLEASAVGQRFVADLAKRAIGVTGWAGLDSYLERGRDGRVGFRQAMVWEIAYGKLGGERKAEVHRATAQALATGHAAPEVLALHHARAGDHAEAWKYGLATGRRAMDAGAPVEAAAALELALAAAPHLSRVPAKDLGAAAELLGDATAATDRFDDADHAYLSAADEFTQRRDAMRLLRKRVALRRLQGDHAAALRMLTRAIGELPEGSAAGERALLETDYAAIRLEQGRYREAVTRCDTAIGLAKRARNKVALAHAHLVRGQGAAFLEPGAGRGDLIRALDLVAADDHSLHVDIQTTLAGQADHDGAWGEAIHYLRGAAEHAESAGDFAAAGAAGRRLGLILLAQGRLDEASRWLEQARVAARWGGAAAVAAGAAVGLATVVARRGDPRSALVLLDGSLATLEAIGAGAEVVANRLAIAEAHLLGGDVEEALGAAEKAIEAAEGFGGATGSRIGLWRIRGITLVWLGRGQEGRVQLMAALEAARAAGTVFEEVLVSDALATLFGDEDAADRGDALAQRLGIVKLPPFLTGS